MIYATLAQQTSKIVNTLTNKAIHNNKYSSLVFLTFMALHTRDKVINLTDWGKTALGNWAINQTKVVLTWQILWLLLLLLVLLLLLLSFIVLSRFLHPGIYLLFRVHWILRRRPHILSARHVLHTLGRKMFPVMTRAYIPAVIWHWRQVTLLLRKIISTWGWGARVPEIAPAAVIITISIFRGIIRIKWLMLVIIKSCLLHFAIT